MKNKKRLRLSHSLLLCWMQGRYNDAIDLYLHIDSPKSEAMEDGIAHHKKWAQEIDKKKELKFGRSILKFNSPQTEKEIIVPYKDYDLKGIFDCLDGDTLYEFKSGRMTSLEYLQGYQLALYFLIAKLSQIQISKAILAHYNQHENTADISIVWNNSGEIDRAVNLIETMAPEIEQYFRKKKILI